MFSKKNTTLKKEHLGRSELPDERLRVVEKK